MSKQSSGAKRRALTFGWVIIFLGALLVGLYFVTPVLSLPISTQVAIYCLYVGGALAIVGLLVVIVTSASKGKKKTAEADMSFVPTDEELIRQAPSKSNVLGANATFVAVEAKQDFQFVDMGERQSVEQKFDQIAKMDKTQFVIYVARLFSLKGYQVKLTPVVQNHDVDMIVEKMGVPIAVGCILSDRVLGKEDLQRIVEGARFYSVSNSMALTNLYFDRSALEYANQHAMSLIDRAILAEDFM